LLDSLLQESIYILEFPLKTISLSDESENYKNRKNELRDHQRKHVRCLVTR